MEVIILAGGLGTRLRSVVADLPKPMADISGRPFLAYLLDDAAAQGASRFLLSVGYRRERIVDFFGTTYNGIPIEYVPEERPLGTGGAIRAALRKAREDDVIVLNGDSFLELDMRALMELHRRRNAPLTLAVKRMEQTDRYGTVVIQDGRAVGFLEKAEGQSGCINGGVYALNRGRAFELLEGYPDPFSFERDALQKNIELFRGFVYITDGYFIDIGVPEDYSRAQNELTRHIRHHTQ